MESLDGIRGLSGGTVGSREVSGSLVCVTYSRNSSAPRALLGALLDPRYYRGEASTKAVWIQNRPLHPGD